jgi:hypothetical protein
MDGDWGDEDDMEKGPGVAGIRPMGRMAFRKQPWQRL